MLLLIDCVDLVGQKYDNGMCLNGDMFVGFWDVKKFISVIG